LIVKNLQNIFSNWRYISLAAIIAIGFWILFSALDELLFFSPFVAFWIPSDAMTNFIISNVMAVMIGIVLSMNIYYLLECRIGNNASNSSNFSQFVEGTNDKNKNIQNQNFKNIKKGFISKYIYMLPVPAIVSSACISCSSSLGLWVITSVASVTGIGAATAFSSFLSEYQIPIRLVILALLTWGFVSINKEISRSPQCRIVSI
jgi:hypothetical protein